MLYLLAQQFIVAGVSEPVGDLRVDHLDLLDNRVLQLSNFRGNDGVEAGHYWVVVEDGLLFEVLHFWRDFRDGVLCELDAPNELGDIGPGRLAGGAIDETEGFHLEVQYFVQSLYHIIDHFHLLAFAHYHTLI